MKLVLCLAFAAVIVGPLLADTLLDDSPNHRVIYDGGLVCLQTRDGQVLTRWPVGAAVSSADPRPPVAASAELPEHEPEMTTEDGVPVATWRWLPSEGPVAEQVETMRFTPTHVVYQVSVRWREDAPTFMRMVYGAHLSPGCTDLEGLWQSTASPPDSSVEWLPTPVPGVNGETGEAWLTRPVTIGPGSEDLTLLLGGVDDEDVTYWDGEEIGRTPLDMSAASWERPRRYTIAAPTAGEHDLTVLVKNENGAGGIWRGPCVLGQEDALDATPSGDGWTRATASGSRLFDWCADTYERSLSGRFTVSLTCQDRTVEWVPENITTGGRFQLPPYVVALEGDNGFWGIGTLDLPRAEDGLRVEWRDSSLACPFLLRTGGPDDHDAWTVGPRVALLVGDSETDVLQSYLDAIPSVPERERPEWWSGPEYCTWGEQVYTSRLTDETELSALSQDALATWLARIRDCGLTFPLITLDAGWWQLSQDTVDELHAEGRHVAFWTQPHWAPMWVDEIRDNPDWATKDLSGEPILYGENYLFDFTHEGARDYLQRQIKSYIGPDGWDGDGLKLDFAYTTPPLWVERADPGWGAGEAYRARVLRLFYESVKAVKPEALVTGSSTNPLFGRVQDVCRLNEDWTGNTETYRRRADTVLRVGEWALADDWDARLDLLEAQAVQRVVWGGLTIGSINYRGDAGNYPRPISDAWTKRLHALTYLSSCAPVRSGQRFKRFPDGIGRFDASGDPVALGLRLEAGDGQPQVLVVADGADLLVASMADGQVTIPTPLAPLDVQATLHHGGIEPADWEHVDGGLRLTVRDSAGPVAWYRVMLDGGTTPRSSQAD